MNKKTALVVGVVFVAVSVTIQNFLSVVGFTETIVKGGLGIELVYKLGGLVGGIGYLTLLIVGALWVFTENRT